MKRLSFVCVLACCLPMGNALAETASSTAPDKTALEAALSACASSVSADSSGRPDMKSMESCMTAKGFSRPGGSPPDGGQGNPPSSK